MRGLKELVKDERLRARVLERVEEFELNRRASNEKWFRELLLCILTANSSFISAYGAWNNIYDIILTGDRNLISKRLRDSGYRFYNIKSGYLVSALKWRRSLRDAVFPVAKRDQFEAREFLLQIDGIGLKEASHFLRNVGFYELGIIDRHVIDYLSEYVPVKTSLTRKRYLYLESVLSSISRNFNLKPGILDLYLWYRETGTILK